MCSAPVGAESCHAPAETPCYPSRMVPDSPPPFATPAELAGVLSELSRREPIFHRPEFGISRADFEKMTADDFWEVGASGRRYSRAVVLEELERRFSAPENDAWETLDFHCRELASGVYLLTYTLVQDAGHDDARRSRRSSIWQRTAEGWKIVYHQGTLVQEEIGSSKDRNKQPPGRTKGEG